MKELRFIFLFMFLPLLMIPQRPEKCIAQYKVCSGFAISKPMCELPVAKESDKVNKEVPEINMKKKLPAQVNRTLQPASDPVIQSGMGNKITTPPLVNFEAQPGTGSASRPDPSGAAGPAHYVQAVNFEYCVYNKTGATLGGPYYLNALWPGCWDGGDPIVLYDKYADRWLIHQIEVTNWDGIAVAISTSSDPLGTYYTYTFVPESGDMPDFGKFSIWSDGYYCTMNYYSGKKEMIVMDRAKMLAGDPTAGMIKINFPPLPTTWFFSPLPADADGQLPPYGTPCPVFFFEDDSWSPGGADQLRIYKFTTDWVTPSNSSLVLDQILPNSPINVDFDPGYEDIPQPMTTKKLFSFGMVLNYRAQYRRWAGYNSVVLDHAVIVDSTTKQTGVRWYELRQNTLTNAWSIYQEGTYAPDLHSRWMPSLAMDDNGSIGIAYAISSSTMYPSLAYTGRNASDPLGQMTFSETIAIAGTSSHPNYNFGDYSHTCLDPDGVTFWHTGEYISGGKKTRVFSWQMPNFAGVNELSGKPELLVFQNENSLNIKGVKLPNNDQTQVDLFDVLGKLISAKVVQPVANSLETTIDVSALAKGTYLVRIGNEKFQKVVKAAIN